MNDQETHIHTRLAKLHKAYTKSLSSRLAPYSVSPGYLDVLAILWHKHPQTQKEIHAQLDIEQATLSNTLQRMMRDQLITTQNDSKDRRLKYISLTQKAVDLQPIVQEALSDIQETTNKGLTFNDLRYFNRILKQMTQQLEEDQVEPLLVLLDEVES